MITPWKPPSSASLVCFLTEDYKELRRTVLLPWLYSTFVGTENSATVTARTSTPTGRARQGPQSLECGKSTPFPSWLSLLNLR
jgi:hypothetical protein